MSEHSETSIFSFFLSLIRKSEKISIKERPIRRGGGPASSGEWEKIEMFLLNFSNSSIEFSVSAMKEGYRYGTIETAVVVYINNPSYDGFGELSKIRIEFLPTKEGGEIMIIPKFPFLTKFNRESVEHAKKFIGWLKTEGLEINFDDKKRLKRIAEWLSKKEVGNNLEVDYHYLRGVWSVPHESEGREDSWFISYYKSEHKS